VQYDGPISESLQLLVVQPTPFCNIQCDYCYLPNRESTGRIQKETFRRVLRTVFSSGLVNDPLSIVWHAGEPLTLPVSFYSDLFSVIRELDIPLKSIRHSIQTNGILISEEWCDFFSEFEVNIGLSIDGPASIHDRHRRDRLGNGTHQRVLKGVKLLQERKINFHVIAVVTSDALDHAEEIFDFFLELGISRLGFNVEEIEGDHQVSSLCGRKLEDRLRSFWVRLYERQQASGGRIRIREFDQAYNNIVWGPTGVTAKQSMQRNSQVSPFAIVSADCRGNLSSFSPELLGLKSIEYGDFNFGNVNSGELLDVLKNPRFDALANDIYAGVKACKKSCQYFDLCGGGAPANKYFENGSFISTETMYCRTSIQMPIDIVLADLERQFRLKTTS
jgi:uncharacterized protein